MGRKAFHAAHAVLFGFLNHYVREDEMKGFSRFQHEGVLRDLTRVKDHFSDDARLVFGSSGEGELTIKAPVYTAYVRKYKRRDGWRVAICRGSKELEVARLGSESEVLELLNKKLR